MELIKPCPFCGSTKIEHSCKRAGNTYHTYRDDKGESKADYLGVLYGTFYCKNCHAYGPRALIKYPAHANLSKPECKKYLDQAKAEALKLWNSRNE